MALNESTGEVRWRLHIGFPVGSVTVGGGWSFAGAGNNSVYAVDPASGQVRWEAKTGGPVTGGARRVGATVYAGSDDLYLHAIDAATGAERWKFFAGGAVRADSGGGRRRGRRADGDRRAHRRHALSIGAHALIRRHASAAGSGAGQLQLHHVAELGGARRVAGEERRRVGRRLLDDVDALGHHDLVAHHHVGRRDAVDGEAHLVARRQLVDLAERAAMAHTMGGDDGVAQLAGRRGTGPQARAFVEGGQVDAPEQRQGQADLGDLDAADLWPRIAAVEGRSLGYG